MIHKDLFVWQKSMDLVEKVYMFVEDISNHERYGIVSQMQRSAASVPYNITEGASRRTRKDYLKFLDIARSSLTELETQYIITQRLQLCPENPELIELINFTGKMLTNLMKSLRSKT